MCGENNIIRSFCILAMYRLQGNIPPFCYFDHIYIKKAATVVVEEDVAVVVEKVTSDAAVAP